MEKKGIKEQIIDLIMGLYERPSYVTRNCINVELERECLDITMFRDYHVKLYFDEPGADVAVCEGGGYGRQDLLYAADIMDERHEILTIAKEWRKEISK